MGRRPLFAATSFVGVVLAHAVSYVSPFGEAAGGHGPSHEHFHLLITAACLLVPLILLLGVRGALRGDGPVEVRRVGVRIAAVQVTGFGLLELAERGFHVAATFTDPVVVAGLVLQLLVAAVLVWLLAGLVKVVTSIAASLRPARPADAKTVRPAAMFRPAFPRTPFLRQLLGRAPPSPSS